MSKISVVIPIFGVEKYIERCARSLFEQTLRDIEYIFVNDCTQDDSIHILMKTLENYPYRKSQVRIINHPQNMGAAQSRKDGIYAASGQYVIQCDSDDWVNKQMYEDMLIKAEAHDADLVICQKIYMDNGDCREVITDDISLNKEQMLSMIIRGETSVSLCNRLVKKDIFHDKRFIFPSSHMKEDTVISAQLTYLSKTTVIVEGPYYHYFNNAASICQLNTEAACVRRWSDSKRNVDILIRFLKQEGILKRYNQELNILQFQVKGFLLPQLRKNLVHWSQWYETYPHLNFAIFFMRISFNLKIIHLLTLLRLYPLISRLKILKYA